MNTCSISLIKEIEIKTTLREPSFLIKLEKKQVFDNILYWPDCDEIDNLTHRLREYK